MKCFILKLFVIFMNFVYLFFKILPSKDKIVMISRQSNSITLDFELIKNKINKHRKYKVVILCKKLEGKENASFISMIKYFFHMFVQMYHLATSRFVILDSYCILVSILKHKKSLKVMQIWHSVGTMKKFGYAILDQEEGASSKIAKILRMHKNYDVILCGGEGYLNDLSEQFNYDKKYFKIVPLPRIDLLNDKKYIKKVQQDILKKYPILKTKKNIIYVPTFRKDETFLEKNIYKIINNINFDKYNLIIKLHPLSNVKINNKNVILDNSFSSIDMVMVSDYVITDYSCILYEAGILNKPLYFYCFDYEEYNNNRSLNIDYFNDLPGIVSKNFNDIIFSIENEKYDYKKLKKFINKYVSYKDNSCNLIYKIIDDMIKESKK